jgi:hypothetical protein
MASLAIYIETPRNPLDRFERLAERRAWQLDRTDEDEVNLLVAGSFSDLHVSLTWREEVETLHVACRYDLKVPGPRRDEIAKLIAMVNAQLLHGHFDLWRQEGTLIFRNNLVLAGGAEANDAQCDMLIRLAIDACQRYFPAVQFVVWAGRAAEEALESSLFETMGEA